MRPGQRKLRRTIYYEFRAAEETVAESPWDWIERRMRVLPLRRYQETAPHAPQFDWQVSDEFRPVRQGNE